MFNFYLKARGGGMSDFADIPDFPITRKPKVTLEPFVCVICDQLIEDNGFASFRPERHKPPICAICTGHWGRHMRPSRVTRGDYLAMQRLKAIIGRLDWEVHNGKFAKRSITTWGAL